MLETRAFWFTCQGRGKSLRRLASITSASQKPQSAAMARSAFVPPCKCGSRGSGQIVRLAGMNAARGGLARNATSELLHGLSKFVGRGISHILLRNSAWSVQLLKPQFWRFLERDGHERRIHHRPVYSIKNSTGKGPLAYPQALGGPSRAWPGLPGRDIRQLPLAPLQL